MNREIKFRARDTKNNKWLDAVPSMEYLLDDDDSISHHDIDEESSIYTYPKNLLGDTFDNRIIWQQYTGLKDSKGVEIYEGDILKWHEGENNLSEVIFQNGSFMVRGINWGAFWYLSDYYDVYTCFGNIFETPKLLK